MPGSMPVVEGRRHCSGDTPWLRSHVAARRGRALQSLRRGHEAVEMNDANREVSLCYARV